MNSISATSSTTNQISMNPISMTSISIYIPRLSSYINESMIIQEFYIFGIGQVSRVDFTTPNKKPGFTEKIVLYKSAFVHFTNFFETSISANLLCKLQKGESEMLYPTCCAEYWILLMTIKPVPETLMNVHQIVDNCQFLEKKIQQQATIIKQLETQVYEMMEFVVMMNINNTQKSKKKKIMSLQEQILYDMYNDIHDETDATDETDDNDSYS